MESEILQELELIRGYVFVMMCAVILWVIFKFIESAQNVFTGFKKAWDTDFKNRMSNFQDSGEYEKVIAECKEKLEKHPNHNDAVWFLQYLRQKSLGIHMNSTEFCGLKKLVIY